MINYEKKEFGDYQTPLFFTNKVCDYLKNVLKINPQVIIEPTCGIGNFLKSADDYFSNKLLCGIEIDKTKLNQLNNEIQNLWLFNEDIFEFDFSNFDKSKSFLIIGNPPWVTNAELSKMESNNLPVKSNFKGNSGIDSLMGDSNFDISENIIFKMIDEFKDNKSTLAFLCKTTVARNIFKELIRNNIDYSFVKLLNFNCNEIFNVNVSACLFILQFGSMINNDKICEVVDFENPHEVLYKFGFLEDKFYSNLDEIPQIDGECQFEWRQGLKHDCSKIMELTYDGNNYINKNNDVVLIENKLIYPLLKSSNIKKPIITQSSKFVIVTQKKIKQDTQYIKYEAPKTWDYLNINKEFFTKRKSSIYKNAPDFSIFGIGDYSFKKYKVGISGFYKNPIFSLIYGEKSVMLDDTCYFLSFDTYDEAYMTMLILNSNTVQRFLKSIAFLDSKRPYTKKVLKRIDVGKCLEILSLNDLKELEIKLNLDSYINVSIFDKYKDKFSKF